MAANTWNNSTVDGKWSTDANWSLGHVPTATETATFDATSDTACAIDLAANCLGIDINVGYTATITQGAFDITLGTDGFNIAAGVWTGLQTQWVTCAGPFNIAAGTFTSNKTRLRMTGAGTSLYSTTTNTIYTLRISANVWADHSGAGTLSLGGLIIDAGCTLFVGAALTASGLVWVRYNAGALFINSGTIVGVKTSHASDNTLEIRSKAETVVPYLGDLQILTKVIAFATTTANATLPLGADCSCTKSVSIYSSHATWTMTLNLNGHRLECSSMTVGTRGNVTGTGDSSVFCAGRLTQSDATPTTICNGGFPLWATGGQTGMGAQSNYVGNGRSMCRMMARNMPKRLSQKWGVG